MTERQENIFWWLGWSIGWLVLSSAHPDSLLLNLVAEAAIIIACLYKVWPEKR